MVSYTPKHFVAILYPHKGLSNIEPDIELKSVSEPHCKVQLSAVNPSFGCMLQSIKGASMTDFWTVVFEHDLRRELVRRL